MDATLRNGIAAELRQVAATAPVLMSRAASAKLYEIFVLTCLAKSLRKLGATLSAMDSSGQPTSNLEFRLGPGRIYAPATAPGFIQVAYRGIHYEIHNSLRVLGSSKVLHELDVCLIDRDEAMDCRTRQRDPVHNKVRFLAECKFYGSALPLSLGREYLGLSTEFSLRVKTIVSNVISVEIHKLVTKHRGTENFEVTPLKPENVRRFVEWLATELRQVLG